VTRLRVRRSYRDRQTAGGRTIVRLSSPDDEDALERLAQLDSVHRPRGPLLLAEIDHELRAALSLSDGRVFANPFYPTERLVELLKEHAAELSG